MPMSKAYRQRSRFLIVEQINENTWRLKVYDPRKSQGKSSIQNHQVRSMLDVRRVTRAFMGRYQILPELVYHEIDELERFLGAKKKRHELMVNIEIDTVEDTEEQNGDDNADAADEGAPSVHGVGETILARPVGDTE